MIRYSLMSSKSFKMTRNNKFCERSIWPLRCGLGYQNKKVNRYHYHCKPFSTILNTDTTLKTEDIFKDMFSWKNNKELSNFVLKNAVVYRNGPLIAINKPYGLQIRTSLKSQNTSDKKKIIQTLNTVLCSSYKGDLDQLLPYLADGLECKALQTLKSPERFNSGVTLLCSDAQLIKKIKLCYLRVKSSKKLCEEYLAVTVGVPNRKQTSEIVGLALRESEFSGIKQAVILDTVSNKSMKQGKGILVKVEQDCLDTNASGTASLVRISSTSTKWHFLRVYLASLLSPVLGDNVHGARVHFRGMQPKAVNPFSHTAQLPQEVPNDLLSELGLKRGQQALIPVHLHLSKLTIPGFNGNEDLVIQAPVPNSFLWTCNKLGLKVPQ